MWDNDAYGLGRGIGHHCLGSWDRGIIAIGRGIGVSLS